jgi:hypothetical protein
MRSAHGANPGRLCCLPACVRQGTEARRNNASAAGHIGISSPLTGTAGADIPILLIFGLRLQATFDMYRNGGRLTSTTFPH